MKKLASILAVTAVVANLGIAAVFAATTSGEQTIGCGTGDVLSSEPAVTFESRTTNFYNEADAALSGASLAISYVDNRGYDDTATECAQGQQFSIVSADGLQKDAVAPSLHMIVDANAATLACSGTCLPADPVADLVAVKETSTGRISTAKTLFHTVESISGTLTYDLAGTDLQVDHTSVTGPILQGTYSGTITISQADYTG